jgi:riboflavin kinase / FMN adenylyltransferase
MRIARDVAETAGFSPSALTIGNFDGVHIGHQHLLRKTCDFAKSIGAAPTVLTFDPHPSRVVAPERTPRLLTTIDERCAWMAAEGIEQVLVLPFTLEIARLTPDEFVRDILVTALRAKVVLVGENFRFGHKQSGDTKVLNTLGQQDGFEVCLAEPVTCRGQVVSSSGIRKFLDSGEAGMAWRFLGRPYSITGEVIHGRGVGSRQTVPTLNLKTSAEVLPRNGVYVTRTREIGGVTREPRRWNSISNIGIRPTFENAEDSPHKLSIETFLLDTLIGDAPQRIVLEFLHRVRDERKFESPEALKAQIFRDVRQANSFFRLAGRLPESVSRE